MLTPVGPHAPSVYWRRRLATLAVLGVAVALIVSVAVAIFGNDPSGASASKPAAASSSTSTKSAGQAANSGQSDTASGSEAAAASEAAATNTAPPADAAAAEAPATEAPATEAPAPAPAVCDNSQIEVQAAVATDPIRVGDKPKLVLSVVNHAPTDCVRDLNAAGQELLIYGTDGARLWSSNDCYPEASNDTRLLTPGQKVDFTVVWSGKSSGPGCSIPRKVLGAGAYLLEASQGGVVSARVPLNIQP